MTSIIPAILETTPEKFRAALAPLERVAERLHVDAADGTFVPNTTLSLSELAAAEPHVPYRIHLMYSHPTLTIEQLPVLSAESIIVHAEAAGKRLLEVLEKISARGKRPGVALNPGTPTAAIEAHLDRIPFVLFLSVQPGFQASPFVPGVPDKIRAFREKFPNVPAGIDGGITLERLPEILPLGLAEIVVGAAITKAKDPEASYLAFCEAASSPHHP